jgi:asparagine synthetase B (glutamine-hydrolysing)
VLSLRGDHVYAQPLVDSSTQSVLCWNGEAWKIAGEPIQDNDTESIFESFLRATDSLLDAVDHEDPVRKIAGVISNITGPFSFVFYDAVNSRLYFSRDCLGRRSLLQGLDESGNLRICSVCDSSSSSHFEEVDTDGVHFIDFEQDVLQSALVSGAIKFNPDAIQTLRWEHKDATSSFLVYILSPPRSTQSLTGRTEKPNIADE